MYDKDRKDAEWDNVAETTEAIECVPWIDDTRRGGAEEVDVLLKDGFMGMVGRPVVFLSAVRLLD